MVSVVVVFKIEIARDFYVTKLSKESAIPGVFVDFSVARGELPPPRHGCRRLLASPPGIKLSLRTWRSNSVSFHLTQTFPEKNACLLQSCPAQEVCSVYVRKRAFPTSDCMIRSSIDGSGSANRKGPGATRRSLQIAAHVDSFRSTPNCSQHKQL